MTPHDDFSLIAIGPLHRLARRCGLPRGRPGFIVLGVLLAAVTWLPLVVLTAADHRLTSGPAVPFASAIATHTRLLVTIPLFCIAEALFNERVRQAVRAIVNNVVPLERHARVAARFGPLSRRREAWLADGLPLVPVIALAFRGVPTSLPSDVTTWMHGTTGALTPAGWWYAVVSLPVSQFLIFRWCVHLLRWWHTAWRLSRIDLHLVPTHPDHAGGLGALGGAHVALWPLATGASAMVVSVFAEQMLFAHAEPARFAVPLVGFTVGITLVLTAPLLIFAVRLLETRQRGLREYGALAHRYVRAFDTKWIRHGPPAGESLLGSPDVQSLADLSGAFEIISTMRVVPITRTQFLTLLIAAVLPAVPLVFLFVSLDELVLRGLRAVLQL